MEKKKDRERVSEGRREKTGGKKGETGGRKTKRGQALGQGARKEDRRANYYVHVMGLQLLCRDDGLYVPRTICLSLMNAGDEDT